MKQKMQPYSPGNPPMYPVNGDINPKELFKALWDGKLIVILITTLFAVGSVIFALSASELWSSNAKITKSQPQDLAAYQQQVKQFQPVFNVYQEDGTVIVSNELERLVNSGMLFQRFVDTFNSVNNKRTFLEQDPNFQKVKDAVFLESPEMNADSIRAMYSSWLGRVSASKVDEKGTNSPYVLTFQAMSKKSSFDLLNAYISATESKVHQDAFNNLRATVNSKRNELIQQKRILENQALNQLAVETERTKYAVGIARAANVEKPVQIGNDNELFGIELGSKGLEAKVQALESVKNLSVIEPRLLQINAKLNMLNNLEIERNVEFQTFRFLDNVQQPITRDKPKRALIVFIGTLLGGVFGLVIVLIRFAFRKED